MIVRGEITKIKLEHIYNTIQNIIKDNDCYYSQEEIKELKKNKKNIFIEKEKI